MRVRAFLCGVWLAAGALIAPANGVATQNFGRTLSLPVASTPIEWPELTGLAGPYGGLEDATDAQAMLADGFGLAVLNGPSAAVVKPLRAAGAKYIDARVWRLLYNVCQRQGAVAAAAGKPPTCVVSTAEHAAIVAQASDYLKTVEREAALVGFWILDDYPHGDVSATLRDLRGLVQHSNARSGFRRPTICGVGGLLDFKRRPEDGAFASDHRYFDQSLENVSPAACDLVSPYPYGIASTDDPRLIDWSMGKFLPYFQAALWERGFPAGAQVVIPIAHAFSHKGAVGAAFYVKPTANDVVDQMRAYCDSGAIAMLFFTWQSPDADRSYVNDPDLRDGVRRGRLACTKVWRTRFRV